VFLDQNGVRNLIRTENMDLWAEKNYERKLKSEVKCSLKTFLKLDQFESLRSLLMLIAAKL